MKQSFCGRMPTSRNHLLAFVLSLSTRTPVASSDALRGSLTAYQIKMNIYPFYYFAIKRKRIKQKNYQTPYPNVKHGLVTKLVDLNTSKGQPRNHPHARSGTEGMSSPVCHNTRSTWARAQHLVNGRGRDNS